MRRRRSPDESGDSVVVKKRLIACLVVRDGLIVQSIGFRRYLPIGRPKIAIEFVAKWDVDEIVLLDMTATRQGRGPDLEMIGIAVERCFVPLTVGGGIRTLSQVHEVLRAGADKVAVNTAAVSSVDFISRCADAYGNQCIVVSIDARESAPGEYEVVTDSGSRGTGLDPADWAAMVQRHGAGEILINSVDRDGSKRGYDLALIRRVAEAVSIPVIACGGVGSYRDFAPGILEGGASAVAAANIFHYIEHSTIVAKAHLRRAGVDVRLDSLAQYDKLQFDDQGRLLKLSDAALEQVTHSRHILETI